MKNKKDNNEENSISVIWLILLFIIFSSNKESDLTGIEKELDEIKKLLTNKK